MKRSKLIVTIEVEHKEDGDLRGDYVLDAANQLTRDVFGENSRLLSMNYALNPPLAPVDHGEYPWLGDGEPKMSTPEPGAELDYDEPGECRRCHSIENMELREVSWNNGRAKAWICDICGHAHLSELL